MSGLATISAWEFLQQVQSLSPHRPAAALFSYFSEISHFYIATYESTPEQKLSPACLYSAQSRPSPCLSHPSASAHSTIGRSTQASNTVHPSSISVSLHTVQTSA